VAKRERTYEGSIPLVSFGALTAAIIAVITLLHGAAIYIPTLLWSLDLMEVDPQVYRMVWWGLGHSSQQINVAAQVSVWYLLAALTVGGVVVSEKVSRMAFALYILFTLGGLSMVNATLTLPGLAGIVLSIGIAVDANVLIFERIREELLHGKTVRLAIDEGFKHAMNAIVDSNVCTVLTALFLFQFGTGPVKGFAVTLILGIIASMITAVFVTRTFFMIWLQRRPAMSTLSI